MKCSFSLIQITLAISHQNFAFVRTQLAYHCIFITCCISLLGKTSPIHESSLKQQARLENSNQSRSLTLVMGERLPIIVTLKWHRMAVCEPSWLQAEAIQIPYRLGFLHTFRVFKGQGTTHEPCGVSSGDIAWVVSFSASTSLQAWAEDHHAVFIAR